MAVEVWRPGQQHLTIATARRHTSTAIAARNLRYRHPPAEQPRRLAILLTSARKLVVVLARGRP
eukprot:10200450-Lingulodinium_polyedra.AAC.1